VLYDDVNTYITPTNALFYNLCIEYTASTQLPLTHTKRHTNPLTVTNHKPLTTHHTVQVFTQLVMSDILKGNFTLLFVFFKMGSNLDQGITFVHKQLVTT